MWIPYFTFSNDHTPTLALCVASGGVFSSSSSSPQKSSVIINFLLVQSYFLLQNVTMDQFLLYSAFFIALLALFFSLYAGVRVGNFISATKDLDWTAIANMTGDLASTKKTIQTLNNRINGMHSPKVAEQELMMQLLQKQGQGMSNGKTQQIGG